MTILHYKTMTSFAINNKHLSVNEEHFSQSERNRVRSERASSLALPHSSLLDFYDKQQEQCNSVTLLPTNVNGVVRRHSSHYYPMLEDKQQQQQQQPRDTVSTSPLLVGTTGPTACNGRATPATVTINSPARVTHFNFNNKSHQLLIQDMQQQPTSAQLPSLPPISSVVNNDECKYSAANVTASRGSMANANAASAAGTTTASNAATTATAIPATPPPPVPKRTFRGKYSWNTSGSSSLGSNGSPTYGIQTPTKSKQQQQHPQQTQLPQAVTATAFVYPQPQHAGTSDTAGLLGDVYFTGNPNQSLFVDLATRSLYSDSALDAGGISDDDRMSLENSVFDESLTSTPVKIATVNTNGGIIGNKFVGKTLAALTNDLSNAAKRSNRSSSSTVDSTTTSSGYGSQSERLASTSTTADFRSRFSSVDTQSSLDGCATEKTTDSPQHKENNYKIDRTTFAMTHDAMTHEYNALNNNNNNNIGNIASVGQNGSSNNNSFSNQSTLVGTHKLPIVPVRKQYGVPPKIPPPMQMQTASAHNTSQQSLQNSGSSKAPSTVSTSTSTSSAASAGSGTSSGSSMSISTSNIAVSPLTHNANNSIQSLPSQVKQRPIPPTPPTRNQNSFENGSNAMDTGKATQAPPPLTVRNKLNKQKPPPIVYPKLHQRQDSSLSSDSFSVTSSPGYNSKNVMDAPLLQNASRINRSGPGMAMRHQDSNDSFNMTASRYVLGGLSNCGAPATGRNKINYRQDSTISSDSFSQTSSPGYNSKIMEAPLLPSLSVKRLCGVPAPIVCKQKIQNETIEELEQAVPMSPLTKCVSTPASLQTIVRFQNGAPNTMSLQHQIINRRKSSNPYITNGRLKFRLFQVLLNAFALLAIAGGLAAYFNAYPTIKFVNKTIINTIHVEDVSSFGKNPAPGTCLPIIVKFCQGPQIPYNYTVFPNYIGHFGQLETQVDLDAYEALVDVRCYELVSLFLCTLFVPKCGSTGATVPPCKTLCSETMRRCGFFFDVFGLSLPEYLNCKLFKDFESPEECVGLEQVRDLMVAAANPKCDGFQCDQNRCIPEDYVCDGHLDCMDQADEANCERCRSDEIYCGDNRCVSARHICDGVMDCPYGQDERNCIRLSERNGDLGKGVLEVFRINKHEWTPACVKNWDRAVSPTAVCSMLGYSSVNATSVVTYKTHRPLLTSVNVSTDIWKMYAKKRTNLIQEFSNCSSGEDYPIAELTCGNYECGKVKRPRHKISRRIIGGAKANPGSWPFLAAILGGPEKIFYCAGVLISDQWVLTASHCIGNHTVIDLEDWTIQLGVTRRNSFTYSGQKVKVKTVIPHPQYNTAIAHDNDIALFQLSTRVAFQEHLLPVCLPPPKLKQLNPDQLCTVIGWGKREDKDPKSTYEPIVNEVQVPIIRRQQCDEWLDNLTVSDGMICAGYEEGGKDACQGDSGGPLLCPYPGEKDRWFVGGIVSWGIMCAHPKLPGVYANVIKYVPWIQEQMQKHSKPFNEEKFSKYDLHPGGPDILSNLATGLMRKKFNSHENINPMNDDSMENDNRNGNGNRNVFGR